MNDFLLLTVIMFWAWFVINFIITIGFKIRLDEIEKKASKGFE